VKRFGMRRLSVRIFLIILVVLLVPFSAMLWYVTAYMEGLLRDETSLKVVQNLAKGENEVNQLLGRMANISNVFFRDPDITQVFKDDATTYYERYVEFNKVIGDISMQNLYDYIMDDVKITFFDRKNQPYASWSLNYQDHAYLLEQDWVRRSQLARGYVVWSMAARGYDAAARGMPPSQIALARSIMDDTSTDTRLGTLIISIDQQRICEILETYRHSAQDSVFAATPEGEVLFSSANDLPREMLDRIAREYPSPERKSAVFEVNGRAYLLSSYTVSRASVMSHENLRIFYLTDYQRLERQIRSLVFKINLLCALFIVVVVLVALIIAEKIASPMRVLSRRMRDYRVGDAPIPIESGRRDEIGEIYTAYNNMSAHITELFGRLKQEQATREKYHYESLRSKMSPHFLFNTLTSIRWMALIRKADNIRESIDSLATILNYSMTGDDEMVELARELDVVERYCHIQNVRFGNSYRLVTDVPPEASRCRVIKFILQPTVENCFKHAFGPEARSGLITISGRVADGRLLLSVQDNGRGFSEGSISAFRGRRSHDDGRSPGAGIGFNIVDERIRISFGEPYGIELSNAPEGGARVEYRLPAIAPAECGRP